MYVARHYSELYVEDLPKVVTPFFAVSIVKQGFLFSHDMPWGINQYYNVFGHTDAERARLLRKVEEGEVVLLDHSGTGLTYNGDTLSSSPFSQRMAQVAASGRTKPKFGGVSKPKEELSFLSLAESAPDHSGPKIEIPGPTMEEINADATLQGLKPVNFDPVSMAVEGVEDMINAGKAFIDNPSLSGAAAMGMAAIPGRYAEKIAEELPLKKLDGAMSKTLRTMKRFKVPCFEPGNSLKSKFKGRERELESHFARQLKHQENGLNDLTVGEYIENRTRYKEMKRAGTGMAQEDFRKDFALDLNTSLAKSFGKNMSPIEAEIKAAKRTSEIMDNLAALHDPDMIAGGVDKVSRMGDKAVNSSLGAQWRSQSRLAQMDEQAQKALETLGPDAKMNVSLERCSIGGKK